MWKHVLKHNISGKHKSWFGKLSFKKKQQQTAKFKTNENEILLLSQSVNSNTFKAGRHEGLVVVMFNIKLKAMVEFSNLVNLGSFPFSFLINGIPERVLLSDRRKMMLLKKWTF